MARRGETPFRADHVGSLLRPPDLLRARRDLAAVGLAADELRAAGHSAVRRAIGDDFAFLRDNPAAHPRRRNGDRGR